MENDKHLNDYLQESKKLLFEMIDKGIEAFIQSSTAKKGINAEIYHARIRALGEEDKKNLGAFIDEADRKIKAYNATYLEAYKASTTMYADESVKMADENFKDVQSEKPMRHGENAIHELGKRVSDKIREANEKYVLDESTVRKDLALKAEEIVNGFYEKGKEIIEMYVKGEHLPEQN